MNTSQLSEIAQKVYNNRDSVVDKAAKRQTKILIATIQENKGTNMESGHKNCDKKGKRPPIDKKQCAWYKGFGHWKRECSKLREGRKDPNKVKILSVLAMTSHGSAKE